MPWSKLTKQGPYMNGWGNAAWGSTAYGGAKSGDWNVSATTASSWDKIPKASTTWTKI